MNVKNVAEQLLEKVRELPDGTDTTTSRLLTDCGYDLDQLPVNFLFAVHYELYKSAEKAGILLDMSAHEGKVEGLPFNLDFVIRLHQN